MFSVQLLNNGGGGGSSSDREKPGSATVEAWHLRVGVKRN